MVCGRVDTICAKSVENFLYHLSPEHTLWNLGPGGVGRMCNFWGRLLTEDKL